jgi:predicted AAA+ superfamily ATPase
VERDVRHITQAYDLLQLQRFVRLCARRVRQLINSSALAADAGVSQPMANPPRLAVLEAGHVVRGIAPYHVNFGTRLVKAPKLYFSDSGLAAWLLGIQSPGMLDAKPLRGALFVTWVVMETVKHRVQGGDTHPLNSWRNNISTEVDLPLENGTSPTGVEIKSGQTLTDDTVRSLHAWQRHTAAGGGAKPGALIYGRTGGFER